MRARDCRHAVLGALACAALYAGAPAASAALVFDLQPGVPVLAAPPFALSDAVSGFILIADEPAGASAFQAVPPAGPPPAFRRAVLDFRISVGALEWSPATGTAGVLGFLGAGPVIESMTFGARRADCGAGLAPCALDLVDLGTGGSFRLQVYRPADSPSGTPRVDLFRATGVSFAPGRSLQPVPGPATSGLLLAAVAALLAARGTRRRTIASRSPARGAGASPAGRAPAARQGAGPRAPRCPVRRGGSAKRCPDRPSTGPPLAARAASGASPPATQA